MSYGRSYQQYDPIQAESDQKDLIISQLKAELFELNSSSQDFGSLNMALNSLELKYQQLQEDQMRAERDGRLRQEQDLKTITNLRVCEDEIDILRSELQSRNRESQEFSADNLALKEMVQYRTNELQKLKQDSGDYHEQARKLQEQRKNLERTIKRLKDERGQLSGENELLQGEYDKLYQNLRSVEKKIKENEYEIAKIEKNLNQNAKYNENVSVVELMMDLKNKKDTLDSVQNKAQSNEQTISQLDKQIGQLESYLEQAQNDQKSLNNQLQNEIQKGRDLSQNAISLENELKDKDLVIEELRGRIEEMNIKRMSLIDDNKFLNGEIDKSLDIINELNLIRKELLQEVQRFSDEDQRAIKILQRQQQQKDVISKAESKVGQSLSTISHFINQKQ